MAEGGTGLSHGCWHPQHTSAVMNSGRVCSGQAGADGVSLAHVIAPSVPGPHPCCWDVPGDIGLPNGHTDCAPQGSGGHQASWGVGQVISMTTSQHHGGRQHVAVATRSIPGTSALAFGFSCCSGDPPHTQQACPLEAVGSTQGTTAVMGVGWRLMWVSSEL